MRIFTFITVLFFSFSFTSVCIAQSRPDYVEIIMSPDSGDWNYQTGKKAKVTVQVLRNGIAQDGIEINYETGDELMPADREGIVVTRKGQATIELGTMKKPGFRQCVVKVKYNGKEYRKQVKVGFSPEKITPTVKLPDDFDVFWKEVLEQGAKVPMAVETKVLDEFSTHDVEVSLVKIQCLSPGNYIYGFLTKPRKEGKYPVLFSPPGAGVKRITPSLQYARAGFITLEIEIHGIMPLLDEKTYSGISKAFGDYMYTKVTDRNSYYYKKVYAACVRAIDYLCSLDEFDGVNVGVTGGSQGGALAIVTAGLDKRVSFVSSFYPALCDMPGYLYGRAGGWPHMFAPARKGMFPVEIAEKELAYYDVVNFARKIQCVGLYSFGYNDNVCPPTSVFSAVNVVTAPKELVIEPISAHWRFPETLQQGIEWMKGKCKPVQ